MADWELKTRRQLLVGGLATVFVPPSLTPAFASTGPASPRCTFEPQADTPSCDRSISLRNISEALAAGQHPRLVGLTRLDGYVGDAEAKDVVLFGASERGQSELKLDDLILALRAAHGRYYENRNGTRFIVDPFVSIDPNLAALRELDNIAVKDPHRQAKHAEICARPQVVRVGGMPRNCGVAKLLIDADYRMKQVNQGTVVLPISNPFAGSETLRIEQWRQNAERGIFRPAHFKTRYWFEPGLFKFESDSRSKTAALKYAQIVLRDEDQVVNSNRASGRTDPYARAFACSWTERMVDTYRAEPIWRDMSNIFRMLAVARMIADVNLFQDVGFEGGMLLDQYALAETSVPNTLPGLGRLEEIEKQQANGSSTSYRHSVCGGVTASFKRPLDTLPAGETTLAAARLALNSKPKSGTMSWAGTSEARSLYPEEPEFISAARQSPPPPDHQNGSSSGLGSPQVNWPINGRLKGL